MPQRIPDLFTRCAGRKRLSWGKDGIRSVRDTAQTRRRRRHAPTRWEGVLSQLEKLEIGEALRVEIPGGGRREAKQVQSTTLDFARWYGDTWKVTTKSAKTEAGVVVYIKKVAREE